MVKAVSHRPLTAETRLRYQVIPCKICEQSGIGTGFSSDPSVFRCSLFVLTLQTHLHLHVSPTITTNDGALSIKQCSFGTRGAFDRKVLSLDGEVTLF